MYECAVKGAKRRKHSRAVPDHQAVEPVGLFAFPRVIGIKDNYDVEVAVPDMADNRAKQE
jgi:hypothetical protein